MAQLAADGQVIGVIMPCHSDPQDEHDARLVADHFSMPTAQIDLGPAYDRLVESLTNTVGLPPGARRRPVTPPIRARACRLPTSSRACA